MKEERRIEKERQHQETTNKFIEWYTQIVCAIPYLLAVVYVFKNMVNYDLELFTVIVQLYVACFMVIGLLVGWVIAVGSALFLIERSSRKVITTFFSPIVTIPFSWIVLYIAIEILMAFNSCNDGFFGMIDPQYE